jgi:hypothetical protein
MTYATLVACAGCRVLFGLARCSWGCVVAGDSRLLRERVGRFGALLGLKGLVDLAAPVAQALGDLAGHGFELAVVAVIVVEAVADLVVLGLPESAQGTPS